MSELQKILIVDDERFNINALVNMLSHEYKIMVAKDGEQALKAIHTEFPPDLILLDIMMPGINGLEVCRRIKADPNTESIPVIFLSSLDQTDCKTEGFHLGAVDYIVKPFSPQEVRVRVQTHLALKSLRHSLEEQVVVRTKELHSAMQEAKAAERVKSEFIARISHELRSPLNAIIAPVDILLRRATNAQDKAQLEGIYAAANHLFSLITGLLDFSGLENAYEKNEEIFNMYDWIQRIKKSWSLRAERKKLVFRLQVDQVPTSMTCMGDIRRLNQAIEQLLDNAIKFTNSGTVVLSVIPVGFKSGQSVFQFGISDTGIGIPPDYLHLLFDPFTQEESSLTRKHEGMGLGLALTQRLITRLGGKLQIESTLGQGSRFFFTVAFAEKQSQSLQQAPLLAAEEIAIQLLELTELVENGFRDTDTFFFSKVQRWEQTPWSRELQEVVDSVNQYDKKAALEAIRRVQSKLD
ncbi:MAG: hybrid sensor histidine kinase/response regulator [Magnetococcales bacterium]|nr:hybrid sensor histidine kinase/response regulator [Magnetococcales bacterium]